MAVSRDEIPLIPVDRSPALVEKPISVLTPARLMLLITGALALVLPPLLAVGTADNFADPELANLLRFMGVVKLGLALLVGAGVWWRLGGEVDVARSVAYSAAVTLLLSTSLLIVMLFRLPQAVAAYHGAALATLVFAYQDRDLVKLLVR
ncbi:MAG: hypothetical protein AAF184_18975 [Pseudomonadota bacterium]